MAQAPPTAVLRASASDGARQVTSNERAARETSVVRTGLCLISASTLLAMSLEDTGSLAPAGTGAGLPLDASAGLAVTDRNRRTA
jgi:hypothetical protein